jgi:protein-S-isoprenylcysteine O-methyltransferase Ste14
MPYVQQASTARLLLDVTVGAFILGEVAQSLRVRRGATRASLGAELLFRVMFLGAVLLVAAGRALAPRAGIGGGVWLFALAAVIGWPGLLLRWWSFLTLGKYFTVQIRTSLDQPVIDRGPYRVLRHPSYTGLLLAFTGGTLMLGNWVGAAVSVPLLLLAVVHRIRVEERALDAALGKAYRDFAAGRARLVPFVW